MTLAYSDLDGIGEARRAVETAYDAWQQFRQWSPDEVDRLVDVIARAVVPEARRLGALAVEETGYGNVGDKELKNLFNTIAVSDWLRSVRTLGVLWRDEVTRIAGIGEPMGVVAAIIPVTNPTATVIFKTLSAIKSGNAVVHAPHPRAARCCAETARVMAEAAETYGAPRGLIQCLVGADLAGTQELMRHRRTAIVMATGGPAMVRAAYSSGKPTLAVGAGNVPVYVDRTRSDDLDEIADMLLSSKSFDYGTACVAEQAIIVDRPVADRLRHAIRAAGGYFCTWREAEALGKVLFQHNGGLVVDSVGQSPQRLGELAGFQPPPGTRVLLADLESVGRDAPLSAEKLAPVLAYYVVDGADEGIRRAEEILRFGGLGHTAAVHAADSDVVTQFSRVPAARILVDTPCLHGGIGWSCDMDPSFMLGTGTVSGSIVSDNVTALHLINIKRVAYESRPWRSITDLLDERKS
ncbi:MAG: aldehyde dehydrogenase family protein [Nocardioidaceae bacterium]|nr:MAG: aldehyde dehydrogenase family protein [Nocardioidaceae bacterium]